MLFSGTAAVFGAEDGEHFFKARVATKWIPVRVQTQIVINVLSLCSRKLLEEAQCGVALAGMDEKRRHRQVHPAYLSRARFPPARHPSSPSPRKREPGTDGPA